LAVQDFQARLERTVRMEIREPMVHQVLLVLLEQQVTQDHRVRLAL